MVRSEGELATAVASTTNPEVSYLEWGAILGGAVLAGTITMVLLQFGSAVGLVAGSAFLEDGSTSWNVLVAGLWIVLVAISSSAAGGYIAGRMRSRRGNATEDEVEFRDGTHGLVTWGAATLIVSALVTGLAALSAIGASASAQQVDMTAAIVRASANFSTILAFSTAAGSALGAAAAWFAAILGGMHRDQGLSVHELVPKMLRRSAAK